MTEKDVEKDILRLKYQFQIEKIRASLTIMTVGILAFLGTFIWYLERLAFGIAISAIIITISLIFYRNAKNQLKCIVQDMRNLA